MSLISYYVAVPCCSSFCFSQSQAGVLYPLEGQDFSYLSKQDRQGSSNQDKEIKRKN